jgi:GntR family transcriptional repressor for pyruvate dehydrogenase complex
MASETTEGLRVIDRSRIGDQIFDDLKHQIVTAKLRRGDKLPTVRELSALYEVSAPTVREALRGLSVTGLVDVRHGSGAFVSADIESLVAMSLGAVIQMENMGVVDALEILGVLNGYATSCAVKQATTADLRRLRAASDMLRLIDSAEMAANGVRTFHHALVAASHNPLLTAICGFLSNVQVEFAMAVTEGSVETWREILAGLQPVRSRFVDALERRDAKQAAALASEFHATANRLVTSLPQAERFRNSDPQLENLLSSVVSGMDRAAAA